MQPILKRGRLHHLVKGVSRICGHVLKLLHLSKNLEGFALNHPSGFWIVKGKEEIWIDIRVRG